MTSTIKKSPPGQTSTEEAPASASPDQKGGLAKSGGNAGFAPPGGNFRFVAPGGHLGFIAPGGYLGMAAPGGYLGIGALSTQVGVSIPLHASLLSIDPSTLSDKPLFEVGPSVLCWEDDPGSGVLAVRATPVAVAPLDLALAQPLAPAGLYQPGTPWFRYWTGAEALTRGAAFWASVIKRAGGTPAWQKALPLPVNLDAGEDFNAYYSRDEFGLSFFRGSTAFGTVYAGESPDILCHELGHAVLDGLKPQLWNAASHDAAAFHEAFGDISAILSALQIPTLRQAIVAESHGHFYTSSRLSRLAEQLGAAIRLSQPDTVDPDCLRNAVNSFSYMDPIDLPVLAPATQLSSEPHSFSRIFTAAFLEALAGCFALTNDRPEQRTADDLEKVAEYLAKLLIKAILDAPVVSNFFAQVAASMIQLAANDPDARQIDRRIAAVLRGVFTRRSILSLQSVHAFNSLVDQPQFRENLGSDLDLVAVSGGHLGLAMPLVLETASQPRRLAVLSAAPDASPIEPRSAATVARFFADDLFRFGRVDYGAKAPEIMHAGNRLRTHRLEHEGGVARLERRIFDCGLHRH